MKRVKLNMIFALICLLPTFALAGEGKKYNYIPSDAVYRMMEFTKIQFIDVRGHSSYKAEHIKGALDLSLMSLRRGQYPEVPTSTTIITYCGCPHAMAEEAAEIIVRRGFSEVAVLDDGFYAWKDKGYPISSGPAAKSLQKYNYEGRIMIPELYGTRIQLHEDSTGQHEQGWIDKEGRFELHMPFYGASKDKIVRVYAGSHEWEYPLGDNRNMKLK